MRNFSEVKNQLKSLSEVVNSFKSEAVQLRIVEFVLGLELETEKNTIDSDQNKKTIHKKAAKKPTGQTKQKKVGKKSVSQGPQVILQKLVEEGFFSTPKSLNDIVKHCEQNMARKFKTREFAGKIVRLVRSDILVRNKNADNQYEYKNK